MLVYIRVPIKKNFSFARGLHHYLLVYLKNRIYLELNSVPINERNFSINVYSISFYKSEYQFELAREVRIIFHTGRIKRLNIAEYFFHRTGE